jgi:hypothetical protein
MRLSRIGGTKPPGRAANAPRAAPASGIGTCMGTSMGINDKKPYYTTISMRTGGRGGIRTHGTLAGTPVFKTGALNHSATLPCLEFRDLAKCR